MLFAGRTRYATPALADARAASSPRSARCSTYRVLGSAAPGARSDERFRLVRPFPVRLLDGPLFYALLPLRVARELRDFRPEVVLAQSAYEGAAALAGRALARSGAKVVVEVHGDWRTATRMYGGGARARLGRLADALAAWAVRRADAVRVLSPYTTGLVRELGVEPLPGFPGFGDIEPFLAREPVPLPATPRVAFVGVLERYKDVDGLAEAWRLAAPRVPGRGARGRRPRARARTCSRRSSATCRAASSGASAWSPRRWRSCSTGRPASCCRRPRRGSAASSSRPSPAAAPSSAAARAASPTSSRTASTACSSRPAIPQALADALVRLLSDPALAERLAAAARPSIDGLPLTPPAYAERMRALVDEVRSR